MDKQHYDAFLSYTRFDDKNDGGHLTELRERLGNEVQAQTGKPFSIFQDVDDIKLGQQFAERIAVTLHSVTFLIPILTPSFFNSTYCREELRQFLARERQLGRNDLVLPVYYIRCPVLEEPGERAKDALAQEIARRQRADWRGIRFKPFGAEEVRKMLAQMARHIYESMRRRGGDTGIDDVNGVNFFAEEDPIGKQNWPNPINPAPPVQQKQSSRTSGGISMQNQGGRDATQNNFFNRQDEEDAE